MSGAVMGLFFHDTGWMGGYGSYRRRLLRLGHIAFFGLGFMNLVYALSAGTMPVPTPFAQIASAGLVAGVLTMPLVCFLTVWREKFRHLFPVPVFSILTAVVCVLAGWWVQ